MRIGVIGLGFVGSAVKAGFEHACEIKIFDRNPEKRNVIDLATLVGETDGPIFVCVPTPMKADGSCDTSIVEKVVTDLDAVAFMLEARDRVVVIKSTVTPGTTERLAGKCANIRLVFNPEFLTEANFIDDFKNQKRILLGCVPTETYYISHLQMVTDLYRRTLPNASVFWLHATEAELFKYVCNTFLALKVAYCNELYQLCQKLGVNYEAMTEHLARDERLGPTHWRVPGPDGKSGFGGSCFVKDLNALMVVANQLGVKPMIMDAAWQKNLEVRPERDWENLVGRAVSETNETGNPRVS